MTSQLIEGGWKRNKDGNNKFVWNDESVDIRMLGEKRGCNQKKHTHTLKIIGRQKDADILLIALHFLSKNVFSCFCWIKKRRKQKGEASKSVTHTHTHTVHLLFKIIATRKDVWRLWMVQNLGHWSNGHWAKGRWRASPRDRSGREPFPDAFLPILEQVSRPLFFLLCPQLERKFLLSFQFWLCPPPTTTTTTTITLATITTKWKSSWLSEKRKLLNNTFVVCPDTYWSTFASFCRRARSKERNEEAEK